MENLISIQDFKSPVALINSDADVAARITDIISFAQKKYLMQILGKMEYDKFDAAPTNAEWTNFVNGTVYTKSGNTYKYEGITEPLKHLIFFDIQKELSNDPIGLGYVEAEYREGRKLFPIDKVIESWNYAVNIISEYESKFAYYPTVRRFLYDNETDYPDLLFTNFEFKNRFL
jgi:hypothetical protein